MICPQCGYDMGTRSKCLRCGHEEKTLVVVEEHDNNSEDTKKEEEDRPEVKVIDPCNVYLTHPYGVEDDYMMFGGSPFASIFDDLFGDPISDLLGGLFGINLGGRRSSPRGRQQQEEQPKRRRKQGPIVEIDNADVEILDANNNPIDKKKSSQQQPPPHDNPNHKKNNKFRR